ncbi:hypothetical protein BDR06DRAFT_1013021 [Suillus hirtellus]|nr:hypothetical protein BDR06DRAFT_1013021 [Suillus hirtellus]
MTVTFGLSLGYDFAVAGCAGLIYDWVLTFGHEIELVWRQRWSLVTGLYLSMRYLGIIYAVTILLSRILFFAQNWLNMVVAAISGVIMITRLHAMYQRRKMLIFLSVTLLAVTIADGSATAILLRELTSDVYVLSGTYQCTFDFGDESILYYSIYWGFITLWEVITMCLAIWIAVKHFQELRRLSGRRTIGDCFTVLIQSHLVYFASFVIVSCLNLVTLAPVISMSDPWSLQIQMYNSFIGIFLLVQLFVLGPRLILSIREYHAKLVADSDAATGMSSIAFQERVHVSTSSSV